MTSRTGFSEGVVVRCRAMDVVWRGRAVLRNVALAVSYGERFAITGGNGSGKSTLIRVLAGFDRKASRSVEVFETRATDAYALAARRGICLQEAGVASGTEVGEFLVELAEFQFLGRKHALRAARAALGKLGAEHLWGRSCRDISPGERKQVALAQAFMGEPELLILDEPMSDLDQEATDRLLEILDCYPGTVILATRNLDQVRSFCTAGILLDAGTVNSLSAAALATTGAASSREVRAAI